MNEGDVIEILRVGFYTTLQVSGPALAAALISGLLVSLV